MPTEVGAMRALSEIHPRVSQGARGLDPVHIVLLAESIAALGLLEPIVVDLDGHLLAGAHRLAACRLLSMPKAARGPWLLEACPRASRRRVDAALIERAEALTLSEGVMCPTQIPVRVMSLRSVNDLEGALAIEAAENEKRRDYTAAEVRGLLERLRQAGYRTGAGRPRKGERAARPLIAAVIGKSERHVRRLLKEAVSESRKDVRVSERSKALKLLNDLSRNIAKIGRVAQGLEVDALEALRKVLEGRRVQQRLRAARAALEI
ncbi:MAG: hypothetical protein D6744_09360, partial [Planctomycetota bacterium]